MEALGSLYKYKYLSVVKIFFYLVKKIENQTKALKWQSNLAHAILAMEGIEDFESPKTKKRQEKQKSTCRNSNKASKEEKA